MKCQYTGIEFEGSPRQKNHPKVSAFLDAANKEGRHYVGAYLAAKDYLAEIKNAGIADITEAMTYANAAFAAWKNVTAKQIIRKTQGDYLREQKVRRNGREMINELLEAHGYRWEKEDYGTEEDFLPGSYGAGIGEYAGSYWKLYSPDGRNVTVHQALTNIQAK